MARIRFAAVFLLGAMVAVIPSGAVAYPAATCNVTDVTVVGGNDVTVSATVSPAVASDFTLRYGTQVHTAVAVASTTATFETTTVDEPTTTTVVATVVRGGTTLPCTGTVRLLAADADDDSGDGGGLLPSTGAERLTWLIVGGLLVLAGVALVLQSRRHRH